MSPPHRPERAKGQVIVVFALALVAIIGMVGLVIDGAAAFAQQRVAQNGADGTATAGTVVIAEKLSGATRTGAQVRAAVDAVAAANGLGSVDAEYTDDYGQPIGQAIHEVADFVPHSPVRGQSLLVRVSIGRQARRIVEANVNDLGLSGKHWT